MATLILHIDGNDRLVRMSHDECDQLFSGDDKDGATLVSKASRSDLLDKLGAAVIQLNSLVRFLQQQDKAALAELAASVGKP